jgi:mRNA-degrading endonuclease RelE of RelBE toxin-antitoxin system
MMWGMSPKHGTPRAQIIIHPPADQQIQKLQLDPPALRAADRVLVLISQDPGIGKDLVPGGMIREYREEGVRVIYTATVRGSIVIVTYIEA